MAGPLPRAWGGWIIIALILLLVPIFLLVYLYREITRVNEAAPGLRSQLQTAVAEYRAALSADPEMADARRNLDRLTATE